jgi:hypothetical protein
VVENCTQLREINLDHCDNVKSSVVESMVFSSPHFQNGEVSIHESALKVTIKLRG